MIYNAINRQSRAKPAGGKMEAKPMGSKAKSKVKTKARARGNADPVVTEIVRNGVIAVTEEMKTNLMRTAYNIIIYEALDFTTGLFTRERRDRVDRHRPADVHPRHGRDGEGEDPAFRPRGHAAGRHLRHQRRLHTGSHLNHVTLTLPIFHQGVLVGFSCCMAHWLDIGGTLGGVTTDIYSEGLQIPILKLQSAGASTRT